MSNQSQLGSSSRYLTQVNGVFYRAIDPAYRQYALSGSRYAGRYSNEDQPTLYLSSSPEGVNAAMIVHWKTRIETFDILRFDVRADRIFDLRDTRAREIAGIDINSAVAPWQDAVAEGEVPSSWKVRDRLEEMGAQGLIDPSRKAPGLWHLVLFAWNRAGAPQVALADPGVS